MADENSWQELVIRHLALPDWVRLSFADELDLIGPYAKTVLDRHGLLWPPNVHSHLPLVEQAAGGTLLTGFGGDELLSPEQLWRRANQVLARQVAPVPRDALRLMAAYGPAPIRRLAVRRHYTAENLVRPWLRRDAQRQLSEYIIRWVADAPIRWDRSIDAGWWRTAYRCAAEAGLALVGSMHDVIVASPLTQPPVLATLAREGGRTGFPSRTAAMQHLVGDLLPASVVARESKAVMSEAFWNRHSKEFVATWDGSWVDPEIVDISNLRRTWASNGPADGRSYLLLQSTWLAGRGA